VSIDVERVKSFNARYREAQQKAATIKAEIDMNNREIDRLCTELSNDLGITVTRENVEQVYASNVEEINKKLELGEDILNRINNETASAVGNTGNVGNAGNVGMTGNNVNVGNAGNVGMTQQMSVQQMGVQQTGVQQMGVGNTGVGNMNVGMNQSVQNQPVQNQPVQNQTVQGQAVPEGIFSGSPVGTINMFDSI
jgi:hypothetical protein